jgi:hypothetical protein
MQRQSLLWWLAAASVGLLALAAAVSAQSAEVHLADDSRLTPTTTAIQGRLPVLFVHGHNNTNQDTDFNYRKDWQNTFRGLPSFKLALEANTGLGIETYYIRFQDQNRSITQDAAEISDAIDLILHRHDPNYDYPHNAAQTTHVQVVIIAYSKGTISTRQYLKGLLTDRPGFHPVSEFIAIAPPNHGIGTRVFSATTSVAVQQLYNGYHPHRVVADNCGASFGTAEATDYIQLLNDHPITDTLALDAADTYPSEAPGSRVSGDPPTAGTLYLTLFDTLDRDIVGGDVASGDCQGRAVALNLAPNAINIPVAGITDVGWETIPNPFHLFTDQEMKAVAVHQNTVHTGEVICQALYSAVHHRSPVGQTCALDGNGVPIIPPPPRAAAMLTLDFSGSMSAPACPGCATRAAVLKDAVELFGQLWLAVSVPTDRMGVTYFRTNVQQFAVNNETLPLLSAGGDAVAADVRGQMPGQATAMGGGLQRAIEALRDPSVDAEIRRVILFTDGMQNVNPMVVPVGAHHEIINQARPNSNVMPTNIRLDQLGGIAVDTIGIGAGEDFAGLLSDIAAETGGRSWLTTAPDDDLRRFFIEQLINSLRGFSPQLVAYRRGNIGPAGSTEAFAVEDGAHRVVLKVSWKRGDSIDFSVAKDGVDVTSAGHFISGAFYKIFVIDLPAKDRGPIEARGNWQIRIKGKASTAYQAAAIVDGGRITYDAVFNARRPKVGDALDLVVRFAAGGQPIGNSARVTVTLMSPRHVTRDITIAQPKKLAGLEPGMTVAERQSLALAQDPRLWAALKPRQQTLLLTRTDKGDFRVRLHPLVPGIYTAFVTIEGDAEKLGQFSRTVTATAVVYRKGNPPFGPR